LKLREIEKAESTSSYVSGRTEKKLWIEAWFKMNPFHVSRWMC